MENNECFLITCYQQFEYVCMGINQIRSMGSFKRSTIIVVSTSEVPMFKILESWFPNVHVVEFLDAPSEHNHVSPNIAYKNWRHEFLALRIFCSMQLGAVLAWHLGETKLLHLHSDSFWDSSKEQNLVDIFQDLDNYTAIGDLSIHAESTGLRPKGLCLNPEGLFLNLERCHRCGFVFKFSELFIKNIFHHRDYGGTEPMLGQSLHWFLTGKTLEKDEVPHDIFNKELKIIMSRDYHGSFSHGLVNLKGEQ